MAGMAVREERSWVGRGAGSDGKEACQELLCDDLVFGRGRKAQEHVLHAAVGPHLRGAVRRQTEVWRMCVRQTQHIRQLNENVARTGLHRTVSRTACASVLSRLPRLLACSFARLHSTALSHSRACTSAQVAGLVPTPTHRYSPYTQHIDTHVADIRVSPTHPQTRTYRELRNSIERGDELMTVSATKPHMRQPCPWPCPWLV